MPPLSRITLADRVIVTAPAARDPVQLFAEAAVVPGPGALQPLPLAPLIAGLAVVERQLCRRRASPPSVGADLVSGDQVRRE